MTFAYSLGMRLLTPLVAVALGALLAACGPDPVPAPAPPEPTATAVFASDAEALAAAEEAYAAYLEMSDLISSEGGEDPDRIAPFVTVSYLANAQRGSTYLRDNNLRIVGSSRVEDPKLVFFDDFQVQFTFCFDVENSRLLDASGADVTPIDRVNRLALTVTMVVTERRLLVDGSESGSSC